MRNNQWLATKLDALRTAYFADVSIENVILVRFGRISKTRFGSIIARPHKDYSKPVTYITINALFKNEEVPEYVVEATLAHEFVHYTHGFHSPLKRQYPFPHKGGIVNKEIRKRGAGHILEQQEKWTKKEYRNFIANHLTI